MNSTIQSYFIDQFAPSCDQSVGFLCGEIITVQCIIGMKVFHVSVDFIVLQPSLGLFPPVNCNCQKRVSRDVRTNGFKKVFTNVLNVEG